MAPIRTVVSYLAHFLSKSDQNLDELVGQHVYLRSEWMSSICFPIFLCLICRFTSENYCGNDWVLNSKTKNKSRRKQKPVTTMNGLVLKVPAVLFGLELVSTFIFCRFGVWKHNIREKTLYDVLIHHSGNMEDRSWIIAWGEDMVAIVTCLGHHHFHSLLECYLVNNNLKTKACVVRLVYQRKDNITNTEWCVINTVLVTNPTRRPRADDFGVLKYWNVQSKVKYWRLRAA